MYKCAVFVKNKYYSDAGMDFVYSRMREELGKRDIRLDRAVGLYAGYPDITGLECDFSIFWDKDVVLAKRLESYGMRLFNSAYTVEVCDDKEKTFAALDGKIYLPATVCSPLVYDVSDGDDKTFIDLLEKHIGYPVVVKENSGSQGRQVYLANDRSELLSLRKRLMHVPHLYQRFVRGACSGSDTRVYIIGGKAVGAVSRTNTTDFRSNAALGGVMERIELDGPLRASAETVAKALGLEYGSTDFICEEGKYVFIEANSSAYMKNAEKLGIPLASLYADHIAEAVYGTCL